MTDESASATTVCRRSTSGRQALVAACCLAIVVSLSCGSPDERAALGIGVLVPTSATPEAATMQRAMQAYADEAGLRIFWRDGDTADPAADVEEQEGALFAKLLAEHEVSVLIYTPFEHSSGSLIVSQAAAQGIPIVALDEVPENLYVPAFVMTDHLAAGEEAARAAIAYVERLQRVNIRDEINALVVDGTWRSEPERLVATGFYNVLDATPSVRVVSRSTVENPDEAFRFVGEGLNSYAGNVQLLLVASSRYVPGAILASQTHGLGAWLVSSGVGASEEACRLIARQAHDFEVDTWPSERARLAAQIAERLAHDDLPDPDAVYENGAARVPVFSAPRRLISLDNVALMADLWPNLYPE